MPDPKTRDIVKAEPDHTCNVCGGTATWCDLASEDEYDSFFCDVDKP